MEIGYYCKPCGETLTEGQLTCPFCGRDATPVDELEPECESDATK